MTVAHRIPAPSVARELGCDLSWEDYLRLEEPPGYYYEFDEGVLLVSPTGRNRHSRVITVLASLLEAYEEATDGRESMVFVEQSFFMPSGKRDHRPDLGIVTDDRKDRYSEYEDGYFEGAPNIVIEVLSPPTARRDRQLKAARYYEQGAEEFWLFEPESRVAEFYRRSPEGWARVPVESGVYQSPLLPGFRLEPSEVFRRAGRSGGGAGGARS